MARAGTSDVGCNGYDGDTDIGDLSAGTDDK